MFTEPELKTYHGNCHCAAYRFTVKLPALNSVLECNCSFCHKHGALWPQSRLSKDDLNVTREGPLASYEFGTKTIEYKFCPTCGTLLFGHIKDGPVDAEVILNIHCLQDVDFWLLELSHVNNTGRKPSYLPPPPPSHTLVPDEPAGEKLYTGSCHCGAVTLALKSKRLGEGEAEVKECNCSYCIRNGWLLTYPNLPQLAFSPPSSTSTSTSTATSTSTSTSSTTLTTYTYGKSFMTQYFCSTCGANPYSRVRGPPEHVTRDWTGARRDMLERKLAIVPVNVRCLDLDEEELERVTKGAVKEDGRSVEPMYVVE